MRRRQVLLQFSEALLRRLDRLSKEQGRSRSAVVRDAVERYVTEESEAEKDRLLIAGYERIPDTAEFDQWNKQAARRLTEEEPW